MLECSARFLNKVERVSDDRQDSAEAKLIEQGKPKHCFISTTNYQLAFYNGKEEQHPFFEVKVREVEASRDSDSLTFIEKKTNKAMFEITGSNSVLEKLEAASKSYSTKAAANLLIDTPYYRSRDSYLTNVNKNYNFQGVITLLAVVCMFAKVRDIVNNHLTYGLLPPIDLGDYKLLLCVYAFFTMALSSLIMMGIEKLAFKKIIPNNFAAFLEVLNIGLTFMYPAFFCHTFKPHVFISLSYPVLASIHILKMISYVHLMYEVRKSLPETLSAESLKSLESSKENLDVIQKHADNISGIVNAKDLLYFFLAPTLIFQLWYPRTEKIDKKRLARLGGELTLSVSFAMYWMNQHMIPVIRAITDAYLSGSKAQILDKILDASNTFLVFVVVTSYLFFHTFHNFLAEALRFANNDFYYDWWSNSTVADFWNRWNLPVHRWCVRHIYKPALKHGHSRLTASLAVFAFSGIMHEYFFYIAGNMQIFYAFAWLTVQAPLLFLERKYIDKVKKYHIANIYVWGGLWSTIIAVGAIIYRIKYLQEGTGK